MARNREKKGSLLHQVKTALDEKLAIGESKFEDKKIGATADKIYSWNTYKTYLKHNIYFIQWAKETHQIKSLDEGKKYVNEWLEMREKQGLSAYTVKLETSALMKLYNISSKDIYKSNVRYRANINRSRGEKVRDKHFSEKNHKDLVRFCRATGLRRAELQQLRGTDLIEINGEPFISITRGAKGGRHRNIPLTFEKDFIQALMRSKGEGKVFEKVPNGADIHSYRAEFATRLYKKLARDIDSLPKSEKYHCRKDLKGVCYDKKAMLEVSRALGHNRISVIAGHYIRK